MKETIPKVNKTKSWFFEKINKIGKPLVRLTREKSRRLKSIDLELKKEKYNCHCRNTKDHVTLLQATICQ